MTQPNKSCLIICPSPVNGGEPYISAGARDRNRTGTPAINESGGF